MTYPHTPPYLGSESWEQLPKRSPQFVFQSFWEGVVKKWHRWYNYTHFLVKSKPLRHQCCSYWDPGFSCPYFSDNTDLGGDFIYSLTHSTKIYEELGLHRVLCCAYGSDAQGVGRSVGLPNPEWSGGVAKEASQCPGGS